MSLMFDLGIVEVTQNMGVKAKRRIALIEFRTGEHALHYPDGEIEIVPVAGDD